MWLYERDLGPLRSVVIIEAVSYQVDTLTYSIC